MNGMVMYDRETGSLWSQVIGQGVDGQFSGKPLTVVPALQTTWQRRLSMHPGTVVLNKKGRYRSDSYRRYYTDSSLGILGRNQDDDRLHPKEFIVGVTLDGESKAYPFSLLSITPVVNDLVNGQPLVVTFDEGSATGVVFNPRVLDRRLTFLRDQVSGEFLMRDKETDTLWDLLTGGAAGGNSTGADRFPLRVLVFLERL